MKPLVLVGGGHAHTEVLRRFSLRSPDDVELTLVTPWPRPDLRVKRVVLEMKMVMLGVILKGTGVVQERNTVAQVDLPVDLLRPRAGENRHSTD